MTAAPGGGGMNGDEVVEGEKLWSKSMEFNEYHAGECVALMMVFITYLCLGPAFVTVIYKAAAAM